MARARECHQSGACRQNCPSSSTNCLISPSLIAPTLALFPSLFRSMVAAWLEKLSTWTGSDDRPPELTTVDNLSSELLLTPSVAAVKALYGRFCFCSVPFRVCISTFPQSVLSLFAIRVQLSSGITFATENVEYDLVKRPEL